MKLNICIAVVLSLVLFSACKKEPRHYYVHDELEWISFPGKSYWIMEDSSTGLFDSIITYGEMANDFLGEKDRFERKVFSFYDRQGPETVAVWTLNLFAAASKSYSQFTYSSFVDDYELYCKPFVNWPLETNGFNNDYDDVYSFTEILPTMVIQGKSFQEVYHIHFSFPESNSESHWYINKQVGLLKMVHNIKNTRRTLEIVRWK